MKPRVALGAIALLVSAGVLFHARGPVAQAQGSQTFRASTERVRIDALVTRNGLAVGGLHASDFEVLDNGAPQAIELAGGDEALSVGVALDTSGSVIGGRLEHLVAATQELFRLLTPHDRAFLLRFSTNLAIDSDVAHDPFRLGQILGAAQAAGSTSLWDAVATGLAHLTGSGRSLLLLLTDGYGNSNYLDAGRVTALASRSDVVVETILVFRDPETSFPPSSSAADVLRAIDAEAKRQTEADVKSIMDRTQGQGRVQITLNADALHRTLEPLVTLACRSGGSVMSAGNGPALAQQFATILSSFRARYVLSFEPAGTRDGAWHDLKVSVRGRDLKVSARAGYFSSR